MTTTSSRVVWITGAGSGMGRASALLLASAGYQVGLSGRRTDVLQKVAQEIVAQGGRATVAPVDVTDEGSVHAARDLITDAQGPIADLALSAGLNSPRRYWRDQSIADVGAIISTNLLGVANVTDAALPRLRESGGAVVFISSYSGWRFSPDAGVAYSASKKAVSSLAESLNAQENLNGVRACNLCPGDVDSDFLEMRPEVPDARARESMLTPDDVARAVRFVLDSPAHVCVDELVISPVKKGVRS